MKRKMRKGEGMSFREKHPNFPMWISIIALAVSIASPILRKFLEETT